MEATFSTYTMAVMFICAVSSAASFGAYLLTRNRTYIFAASGFFLYFFDLASIFQMENLSHGAPITLEQLYGIQFPYYKALLAAGMLESCWLSICEYLDEKSVTLKIGPGVAFLTGDLLIAAALPDGPIKQWLFYSAREAFLAWCLLFLLFVSLSNRKSSVEKALVLRQKRFIAMVAMIICCIIAENTFVILIWHPSQATLDSMLPLYISERNFSENLLVITLGVIAVRHAADALKLRHVEPPTPRADNQERYVALSMSLFSEKYGLTARERDVLRGIIDGKDNQNIASDLNLVLGTVKSHTHNIFKKAGVATRQELLQKFWGK